MDRLKYRLCVVYSTRFALAGEVMDHVSEAWMD